MTTLKSLEIEDFGCIRYASIPMHDMGMTLISGDNQDTDAANNNGCGKTTLGHALTWGLFEEALDPLYRYDRVIRSGSGQAIVKVAFLTDGIEWLVSRSRIPGRTSLSLAMIKDGAVVSLWPGQSKDIQAKIISLLGRDFRAFCSTSFFGQSDSKRFYSATDSEKKETLHRILRSDVFRICEKQLRESTIKKLYLRVDELAARERELVARRLEHDVEGLKERSASWEAELAEKIDRELAKSNEFVFQARTYDEGAAQKYSRYKIQIANREKEIRRLTPQAEALDGLKSQVELTRAKIQSAREQLAIVEEKIKTAQSQLVLLSGSQCPTCTAPLTAGAPANHIEAIRLESAAGRVERTKLASELRKLQMEHTADNTVLEAARESQLQLQNEQRMIGSLEAEIESTRQNSQAVKKVLKERALEHLERAKTMQRETNPYESYISAALSQVGKLDGELTEIRKKLESERESLAYFEFWVRGFGSRGLPSMLLDSVMPFLTERTNHYLRTLTDGDIVTEFSTLRSLKSKKNETRDEITVSCTIEGVEDSSPSHAQRRKLEIASDMALVDLAATREKTSDLLFLDEVLDGLDAEGEVRVLRLLRALRDRYTSIFVVTHEPRISESFDRVLKVVKKGKAATVAEMR